MWKKIEPPTLNKKGRLCFNNTPRTGHFMVFLVTSYMTSSKGQLPENREIRSQCHKLQTS